MEPRTSPLCQAPSFGSILSTYLSTTPLCSRYRRLHTYITTNDGSIVISFASHNFLGAGWAGSSVFSAPPINDRVIVETVLRIYCDRCNQLRCSIFARAFNGSMEIREISQCLVKLDHLSKNSKSLMGCFKDLC